ncbi:MAG TPA: bifunctional methylenetetrahydrofolate dehydrogenase/methenyltetrahydrofolate cyclohydrolase FolD [Gemmatimonadota bacterium]|nr:bifunctional methylenetetrahydrofolate dehydrogenase/methenyltetrahydrofolate cyclohydrolase FolD [Gemmatimonadota bacterium]
MPAELIDGKAIAADVRREVAAAAADLAEAGTRPGLAVVLVGVDPASQVYVRMKTRACEEVGIAARDIELPADTPQEELEALVDGLNADPGVHGILVQLPLPGDLDETPVVERVRPEKDVDGLHPVNVGRLALGDPDAVRPCTPAGIQELLRRIDFDPEGRRVVIVGRSNLVGRPLASILLQKEPFANATVTVAHSRTRELGAVTREAELLVAAVGRPEIITADMVREGAVVIDVGVNRVDDPSDERGYRLVGDVAFDEVREVASWITPVPGGVGPMTIAMLLHNTVTAAGRAAARGAGAGAAAGDA